MRRNMRRGLFGELHAYLVWPGDILYTHGLTALWFVYRCRKVGWRKLLIAGWRALTYWKRQPVQASGARQAAAA